MSNHLIDENRPCLHCVCSGLAGRGWLRDVPSPRRSAAPRPNWSGWCCWWRA